MISNINSSELNVILPQCGSYEDVSEASIRVPRNTAKFHKMPQLAAKGRKIP